MGKQYVIDVDGYKRRMINPFEPDPVLFNWIDSMLPGIGIALGASAPTLAAFNGGNLKAYTFQFNQDDASYGIVKFNHDVLIGDVELGPHVHWSGDAGSGGNVLWEFEYCYAGPHSSFSTPVVKQVLSPFSGVAWRHEHTSFPKIPMTMTIGMTMVMRLSRLGTDGTDNYAGDTPLLGFDFHHKINSFGSRQEGIK